MRQGANNLCPSCRKISTLCLDSFLPGKCYLCLTPIGEGIQAKSILLVLDFFICYNGDKFSAWKRGNTMETKYYVVARIDGDYAWLNRTDAEEEPLFMARALLPEEIDEGTNLKYEFLQYEII